MFHSKEQIAILGSREELFKLFEWKNSTKYNGIEIQIPF